MLYLFDANVLIDANRDYYPIQRVPEFWNWLLEMGGLGLITIPEETYEEIVSPSSRRPDELADWLRSQRVTMMLDEQVNPELVAAVIDQGYAPDLTDEEIEKVGRDPFLEWSEQVQSTPAKAGVHAPPLPGFLPTQEWL